MATFALQHQVAAITGLSTLTLIAGGLLTYVLTIIIYRLHFHPLAKFPGPPLAAITYGVEFYHDVLRSGRYTWVIKTMHDRYGPIVRISPSELHIDDVEFYNDLYTGPTNPRDKWARTADPFANPTSHFGTVSTELHRARRAPFNAHFSKKSVTALTPLIISHVDTLCQRLTGVKGGQDPINLRYAYAALALDVVSEYAFGEPNGALKVEDFSPDFAQTTEEVAAICHLNMFFPWLAPILFSIPPWIIKRMNPKMMSVVKLQFDMRARIQVVIDDPERSKGRYGNSTIFHEMTTSDMMPDIDRNMTHYMHEGQAVIGAGQMTTAFHLTVTTFWVLKSAGVLQRLKDELASAIPDSSILPSLTELEKLEYLTAVICEGHRITYGIPHRLSRVSPQMPIVYKDWIIPPGSAVGMSAALMHDNPDIFPQPQVFNPDRFLGPEGHTRKKYLVPFSKGTRSCLGQNLANAELYFTLAAVFRRFDLTLFESTEVDVRVKHDYFVPLPQRDSIGVRVLVQ